MTIRARGAGERPEQRHEQRLITRPALSLGVCTRILRATRSPFGVRRPRVRLALRVPLTRVREQPKRSRRRKSFETCPGSGIPARSRDLAVARSPAAPATPSSTRAVRYVKRIGTPSQRVAHGAPGTPRAHLRRGHTRGPRGQQAAPARDAPPPHPDRAARSSPSTHPAAPSAARRSPRSSRAWTIVNAAPTRPSAVNGVQPPPRAPSLRPSSTTAGEAREDLLATPQHLRAATQRLNHTHPRQAPAHDPGTRGSPTTPHEPAPATQTIQARRRDIPLDQRDDVLQHRRQALLAVGEQFVERAPRDPRTTP